MSKLPQLNLDLDAVTKPVVEKLQEGLQSAILSFLNQLKGKVDQAGKRDLSVLAKLEQIKQLAEAFKVQFAEKITVALKEFADKVQQSYPKLLKDFQLGKREVEEAQQSAKDTLKGIFDDSLKQIQQLLAQLASGTLGKVIDIVNPNGAVGKREVLKNFQDAFQQLLQTLQGHVQNVGQTLVDHGKNVVENLKPHYDNLKDELVAHGLNAANSVLEALKNASSQLSGKREVTNKIQELFQQFLDAMKGHAGNIQQTMKDHALNVVENLKPHFDNLKDELTNHGLNAANSVLEALKNASQQLQG